MGLWGLPPVVTNTVTALVILAYFSLVIYKENVFSRWAEYTIVGLGITYTTVAYGWDLVNRCFIPLSQGNLLKLVPLLLGLLAYAMFTTRHKWALRWPLAFIASTALALHLTGIPTDSFILQLKAVALPLVTGNAFDLNQFCLFHEHRAATQDILEFLYGFGVCLNIVSDKVVIYDVFCSVEPEYGKLG